MKWPADTKDFALPVRDADAGQPAESAMRLGVSGIRTVEHVQHNGAVMRLSHRGGNPLYEIVEGGAGSEKYRRGFVAVLPGATTGTLFNPYNLAVVQHGFKPAGALYYVLDFATNWNVSPSDTTNWHDVLAFSGGKIWINAAVRAALEIPVALVTADATPYLIPSVEPGEPYGSSTLNASQKRVFAIARETVRTFVPGAPEATLQPVVPRTDRRAVTLGPVVVPASHQATLAQLYHTLPDWQTPGGDWVCSWSIVQMALAAPVLTRTDGSASIMRHPPAFSSPTSSSSTTNVGKTFPSTEIMLTGSGQVYRYAIAPNAYDHGAIVIFPWAGTISAPLAGKERRTFSRLSYAANASAQVTVAGTALTYTAAAVRTVDMGSERSVVNGQTVVVAANAVIHPHETLEAAGAVCRWVPARTPGDYVGAAQGKPSWSQAAEQEITGSVVTKTWDQQTVTVTVSTPTETVVSIALSRSRTVGPQATIAPVTGYYASQLANPMANVWDTTGMGIAARLYYYEDSTVYNRPFAEVQSYMTPMADAAAGMTYYTDETWAGIDQRQHYTATQSAVQTQETQSVTWTTRDYLLRDETNGVKISVNGSLTGSQTYPAAGQMTVAVTLRVETRHHVNLISLGSLTFAYADLLPQTVALPLGTDMAFPVPRVHLSFAPAYRGQGHFRGASYITAAEETAGAPAAHLFNFRLRLARYSDIATLDELNRTGPEVNFLPVNLIEALYAIVFSQAFGVDIDPYPVTSQSRYEAIVQQFFSQTWDIQIRDGVQGPWPDSVRPGLSATSRLTRT